VIVAFSTSSRLASVALLAEDGAILWEGEEEAPQAASGACMRLLERAFSAVGSSDAVLYVSDLGPGSFTGVRVGVTLAKTFAFAAGVKAAGLAAFDLIAPDRTVVLPNKRGEWFVRRVGDAPERVEELPAEFVGYGPGVADQTFPRAAGFSRLVEKLKPVEPERLLPAYLIEPSIFVPKKPYGAGVAH
jgi:tRNA threonylcarbamoyladenosine biosynthesis protein TsaB